MKFNIESENGLDPHISFMRGNPHEIRVSLLDHPKQVHTRLALNTLIPIFAHQMLEEYKENPHLLTDTKLIDYIPLGIELTNMKLIQSLKHQHAKVKSRVPPKLLFSQLQNELDSDVPIHAFYETKREVYSRCIHALLSLNWGSQLDTFEGYNSLSYGQPSGRK